MVHDSMKIDLFKSRKSSALIAEVSYIKIQTEHSGSTE